MRRALVVLGVVGALAGSACSKSRLAEGDAATPTTPPILGSASTVAPASTASTAPKPAVCKDSDTWGLAIIKATDPASAAGLTPAQLTANLDAAAATFKAANPEFAAQIDTRTEIAKRKLAGTATEADNESDKTASEELNTWFVATCS
ncbi:MAG: hypothetical protein KDB33_13360 [Acidimicrobiales bacterium]|nr:hypothetical protein [Acidimicrobiales bacterium]MCB1261353.1 hypothetical protein [Acidimicrobiales bacterium]